MQQENKYQMLPAEDAVQNWFEENIDKECSASSAVYKFRLWLESLQVAQHPVSAVWPLYVVDTATGTRHEVNKLVYHPKNEPVPHVWCDTWYGHHVIGKDCEWVNGMLTGAVWVKASTRLPEKDGYYCFKANGGYMGAYLRTGSNGNRWWCDSAGGTIRNWKNCEWLDETGQSNKDAVEFIEVFAPCLEDDPRQCGGYTSNDGQSLCYVRELHVPASAEQLYNEYQKQKEGKK